MKGRARSLRPKPTSQRSFFLLQRENLKPVHSPLELLLLHFSSEWLGWTCFPFKADFHTLKAGRRRSPAYSSRRAKRPHRCKRCFRLANFLSKSSHASVRSLHVLLTQNSSEGGGSCERRHFVLHPGGLSGENSTAAGDRHGGLSPGRHLQRRILWS